MPVFRAAIVVLISFTPLPRLFGDTLQFGGDRSMDCIVLQEGAETITVLRHSSILRFSRSGLADVVRDSADTHKISSESPSATRTPSYSAIVVQLAAQKWATDLRQIPATVIDVGVMRNVPYKSHRAGGDYEINVYGDPESPAGFEIGVRGGLLVDDAAKANCVEFVTSLLPTATDKSTVRALKMEKDLVTKNGLTFEITPPTADDSYGGWWVSVYSTAALGSVRASDKELEAITVSKSSVRATHPPAKSGDSAGTTPGNVASTDDIVERASTWNASDLSYSRPARRQTSSAGSGGSVYVRGYTRKDGTYVTPHTRRR